MPTPLEGLRIIDMSAVVMGPFAAQILGDLGADVIKVEPHTGDTTRHVTPMRHKNMGWVFLHANRNKRSLVLDLKDPDGKEASYELVQMGLEHGSGIASRTIASLEHQWGQGREQLTSRDVLVIDEAGMVGTRQMERVLSHAADAGAKVVLVGDPQQLQSIEAGAAFRSTRFCRASAMSLNAVDSNWRSWSSVSSSRVSRRPPAMALAAWAASPSGRMTRLAATMPASAPASVVITPPNIRLRPTLRNVALASARSVNSK